ncbi:tat pathway signal sequence [Phyllosticta citrichinensis]|uniref:Tat pathway signal sequence n=1 Tax=Phyllosticta citrichinensis TaxID=1130410 RepID=A0ABR1XLZ0_9PEZI
MSGRYARLSTDEGKAEDHERLLSDAESSPEIQDRTKSWSSSCIVALWVVTFCFAGFVGAWIGIQQSKHSQTMQSFISKISQYSPIVDDVGVYFRNIRFNGSLMKENIFRQDAGPEVDAAWESLGVNYRALVVPPEKAAKSNLLPDQVKVREKYGGGFIANVEGMHQLHCLNLLREGLYYNYDYYKAKGDGAWVNSDHVIRRHVSHCLDIIRQNLMCNVDIGVLGQVWVQFDDDDPFAYVDFNTKHTCRNFDQIREWAKEHQVPENVPDDFIQPPVDGDTIFDEMP